jgi:nucleoside-diphosphate-sugar epimerase
MTSPLVLVSGGSGFIAGHCILHLLDRGYRVRTTVRSLDKEAAVRAALSKAGMVDGSALDFVAADLLDDAGWPAALEGVDLVLHVASPVAPGHVADEESLIVPARDGAVRVLRAASAAGVTRVVLTSAFHAVSWGHPHDEHVFTETDWTILDGPGVDAYGKSKTLAEQAAWEFVAGTDLELVTMLPVAVMGPMMGGDASGANHLVHSMLAGEMPALANVFIPIVDVRDVAIAHVLALTVPEAAGERFLLSNGPALSLSQIADTIKGAVGVAAHKMPTRRIPDIVVRLVALFSPQFRATARDLGYAKRTSNKKARDVLGWIPRAPEEAIAAAARSMTEG